LLHDKLAEAVASVLPDSADWRPSRRLHIWRALAGHHGRPVNIQAGLRLDLSRIVCAGCLAAADDFIRTMQQVFTPTPWSYPGSEAALIRFSWWLAGFTTLADWIGSREEWFGYEAVNPSTSPSDYYLDIALPRARHAVAEAGLSPAVPAPFRGVRHLFAIDKPAPIQAQVEGVALPQGPVLAVLEDLTGSGKTEAALALSHRLLAAGKARGIYFALPTMATANAMYARLQTTYRALFADNADPSLALAHGKAGLNARFTRAITPPEVAATQDEDPADEPAESHCAAWLAEDRRRALLAQVGVGTLDQALLAILPVRHAPLRLQGLSDKVLIVDEAHAFDAYMRRELATLLRFHAAMGGSAILVSATLPRKLREELVHAFREGLGERKRRTLRETEYPLLTISGAVEAHEIPCDPRPGVPRRVAVTRLADAEVAVARIAAAATQGAAVVWVRNTVDDAIAAMEMLRSQGLQPMLFHARFAMCDRLKIENDVLRCFGKDIEGAERANVLVATQVVEQSLDIDFDVMVTDLAPVDLLIQRAGRLWRHERGARPVPGPELLIVAPDPVDDPDPDWISAMLPGTGSVYRDHALLWRSAREVFRRGAITTPLDMRPLIEAAYDRDAEGAVPAGFVKAAETAEGKEYAATALAQQNVLDLYQGYDNQSGAWEPDTHTSTRLEEQPQVLLRLAVLQDGEIMPYAQDDDLRHAWALSEISVSQFRVTTCTLPAELEASAARAKAAWGKWERESRLVQLALLEVDGDGYRIAALSGAKEISVHYDDCRGLWW